MSDTPRTDALATPEAARRRNWRWQALVAELMALSRQLERENKDREKYLLELLRKASVFIPASPLSMEIEAVLLRSADEH
jgi:hypothetical protein